MKKKDEIKVCLVGSSGGHLTHLYMLKPFWKDKNRFWVTFDKEDARSLLEGEKVYPCYFPTNRSIKALIKNTKIAWDVLHKEKPDLIISCGAAVAVPFFYIGKMMGAKLVYKELYQRLEEHKNLKKLIQKNSGKSVLETKKVALNRKIEQLSGSIVRLESQKRSSYEQYVLGKLSKEKFLELKQGVENEITTLKQTKAEKGKELAVVQEKLRQKKQIAGSTEVLLTADNLQQYVKKIEVDRRKSTYTEFVF